jgi:hypothetical protein
MEEFSEPPEADVLFCQRITKSDYEKQSRETTAYALARLVCDFDLHQQ